MQVSFARTWSRGCWGDTRIPLVLTYIRVVRIGCPIQLFEGTTPLFPRVQRLSWHSVPGDTEWGSSSRGPRGTVCFARRHSSRDPPRCSLGASFGIAEVWSWAFPIIWNAFMFLVLQCNGLWFLAAPGSTALLTARLLQTLPSSTAYSRMWV